MGERKVSIKLIILSVIMMLSCTLIYSEYGQASAPKFNMSYLYFGDVENHVNYVDRTNGALQVVSPSYFDLNDDGSLKISRIFNKNFIEEMHKRGIKVVPFLSNHWNREVGKKALENREDLVNEIYVFIKSYNLDGINVDIENVSHEDRDNYTDFVRLLREKLPADKEVSVAVAANPRDFKLGWHGSYDYEKLAEYSDYLMIMAYDESYYGSDAGPIASIGFVEKSVQYALERVPAEKIVLGIPFYGRYWNLNEYRGGKGIHLTNLESVMDLYDAKVTFDEESLSPKATFEIKEEDSPYYVYGRRLNPGNYEVWYENGDSIKSKIDLVEKYNLKGTGSWSLGQELPDVWKYFTVEINDTEDEVVEKIENEQQGYFYDIKGHWAEKDILTVQEKGWMNGFGKGIFKPNTSLTRAQAATTLVRSFKLDKVETKDSKLNDFKDVKDTHWAKGEIEIARAHGIIRGVDGSTFAPERPVTREEMAAMINRILNLEKPNIHLPLIYNDVSVENWSYDSILSMSYYGVIRGFEDKTFRPKESITRAQIATLLNRVSKYN